MAQLERERLTAVYIDPSLKREVRMAAADEERKITATVTDAITLYLAVKRGDARVEYVGEGN